MSREPGFVLPAAPRDVLRGRTVGGMRCATGRAVDAVHVEIFVDRKVLLLPAGHRPAAAAAARGPLAPRRRQVRLSAAHARPDRHRASSSARAARVLGDLFAVWGQRLAPRRLLSFAGRVRAFRNGREWQGDPRRMPLQRHD